MRWMMMCARHNLLCLLPEHFEMGYMVCAGSSFYTVSHVDRKPLYALHSAAPSRC